MQNKLSRGEDLLTFNSLIGHVEGFLTITRMAKAAYALRFYNVNADVTESIRRQKNDVSNGVCIKSLGCVSSLFGLTDML